MKKRIVVKVGTSTLMRPGGCVNLKSMDHLARVLSDLCGMGHEVILVSSGAIGVGTRKMGLPERPTQLRLKQAAAAVGQCELMHLYDKFFGEYGRTVAQILLTDEDVDNDTRKENLVRTFDALLELGIIPVVNENDSVSSTEIETGHNKILGDNDTLSAIVAVLCRADLLLLFTDIDGLYDGDPKQPGTQRIAVVPEITEAVLALARGSTSGWGTGGMVTKLHAGKIATEAGIEMVIASGENMDAAYGILEGNREIGTTFLAKR